MDIDQIANSQVSHDNKRLLIDYSMLDDRLKEVIIIIIFIIIIIIIIIIFFFPINIY